MSPDELATAAGRHGFTSVDGLHRLSGGASRETWAFDAWAPGGGREPLVLRRAPRGGPHGVGMATEVLLLAAAGRAGVPVPRVRFALDEEDALGEGYVMDHIDGETIPRRILRDERLADVRSRLAHDCGEILARLHTTDVRDVAGLPCLDAAGQIAQYRALLDGFGDPHPAFELGLRWLDEHLPAPVEPALVHGDFRNGNLIVGSDGIRGVLDWELAHLGDPMEDLGWLCVRSWRFGVDDRPVGGFGGYGELFEGYRSAGAGAVVDPGLVRFWEVFGNLKWGVICMVQAYTHLHGVRRSVELATIGRRVCETEYDLLDLIAPARS